MIFSSALFLYLFLPLTLLGYYLSPKVVKNYFLLLASLVFFAWGGVSYTIILIGSIILNYVFGLLIQKNIDSRKGYYWLVAGVTVNLLLLGVFKYANFVTQNINIFLGSFSHAKVPETSILLPIGISFYTFHSLSYLVDIYRRKTTAQRNIFDLSLYISMFSQLVAGPIIRYSDVWQQLKDRQHSVTKFSEGVERFLIGLGKKVLLANTLGVVADTLFKMNPSELGALNAWLGIICYTFQIYCDFAGYSDMAIGLGKMFGFDFLENFNFPYIAKSVKEFWRRWHISLSSFFRDYVYIPLGGNRVGVTRQYVNLIAVFFLTGIWHGAGWNFIVWGLFHGFFLLAERIFLEKVLERSWKPLANLYTLLVVMFAWVLFRVDDLSQGLHYWRAMFVFKTTPEQVSLFYSFMNKEFITVMIISILGSFGAFSKLASFTDKILSSGKPVHLVLSYSYHVCSVVGYAIILILSSMYLIAGSYNPFIYYRF
ncbi:MAG: alginate O-acetyltransferase [Bacteroidetes bacterium]|jgi:alginate O-acetyltransferase complex protein AlgI|nr:alginate O-acetyltransferase [Bacteroidota bacterium]